MTLPVIIVLLTLFLLAAPVALAVPAAIARKSWGWLIAGMALSFVVVVLPLFFFFFSSVMTPNCKDACRHGWVDCFIEGKLAFTPLVLLATVALYKIEVLRKDVSEERWVVLGIFVGAIVAWVCLAFGLVYLEHDAGTLILLLVPFYVAVWYTIRAVYLIRVADFGFLTFLVAAAGTIPFWLLSCGWSYGRYESLPDFPPGCFVVTAAGHGHRKFVGPFWEIERGGKRRQANQQLITLWQFENLWREKSPRSHRHFRRFYNRAGPRVAARIRSPWVADAAFIALKPVELMARCINRKAKL